MSELFVELRRDGHEPLELNVNEITAQSVARAFQVRHYYNSIMYVPYARLATVVWCLLVTRINIGVREQTLPCRLKALQLPLNYDLIMIVVAGSALRMRNKLPPPPPPPLV